MAFSREFLLAAACARWPPSPARTASILDALNGTIDWPHFLHIVRRHRIGGLVNNSLADVAGIPPWARDDMAREAVTIAVSNLQLVAETARLQHLALAATLPVTFLKGVPLALAAFGDVAVRSAKDIDILVSPSRLAAATDLLQSAGYVRVLPPPDLPAAQEATWVQEFKHFSYRHRVSQVEVELHWRLFRNRHLARVPGADTDTVRLPDGTEVRALGRPDLFTYLCAHGAHHGWCRLKWLADISALLAQGSEDDAERLFDAAAERGAMRVAGQALLLAHRLMGTPLSIALLERLRTNRRVRALERRAVTTMLDGYFQTEPGEWPRRAKWQFRRNGLALGGWRFVATGLRQNLVSEHDLCVLPLPRQAAILYPLVHGFFWARERARGR